MEITNLNETLCSALITIQGLSIVSKDNSHALMAMAPQTRLTSATSDPTSNQDAGRNTCKTSDENVDKAGSGAIFLASASYNTWSRAARRDRRADMIIDTPAVATCLDALPPPVTAYTLVCCIQWVADSENPKGITRKWILECNWVKGSDRAMFESFAGHLGRKVKAALLGK
jgi:hypothetical protein